MRHPAQRLSPCKQREQAGGLAAGRAEADRNALADPAGAAELRGGNAGRNEKQLILAAERKDRGASSIAK